MAALAPGPLHQVPVAHFLGVQAPCRCCHEPRVPVAGLQQQLQQQAAAGGKEGCKLRGTSFPPAPCCTSLHVAAHQVTCVLDVQVHSCVCIAFDCTCVGPLYIAFDCTYVGPLTLHLTVHCTCLYLWWATVHCIGLHLLWDTVFCICLYCWWVRLYLTGPKTGHNALPLLETASAEYYLNCSMWVHMGYMWLSSRDCTPPMGTRPMRPWVVYTSCAV